MAAVKAMEAVVVMEAGKAMASVTVAAMADGAVWEDGIRAVPGDKEEDWDTKPVFIKYYLNHN